MKICQKSDKVSSRVFTILQDGGEVYDTQLFRLETGKTAVMSITVQIDSALLHLTNGIKVVEVDGKTVSQCLNFLRVRFPALGSALFQQEQVWSDIGIFLNNESTFLSQLVKDGDELAILMPLGGG